MVLNHHRNDEGQRTNGLLVTLAIGRQLKAIRALIAEAILAEVDAVVDVRVDASCRTGSR